MSEPQIELVSSNLFFTWGVNLDKVKYNSLCTICREPINNNTSNCIEKNLQHCIHVGTCNCFFHSQCITNWVNQNGIDNCPNCNQKWRCSRSVVL